MLSCKFKNICERLHMKKKKKKKKIKKEKTNAGGSFQEL